MINKTNKRSKLFVVVFLRGCIESGKTRENRHPEFISGSDIHCLGILKPRLKSLRAGSSGSLD